MNKTKRSLGNLFNILITLTVLTLLNVAIFDRYAEVALYVNLAFAVLAFLMCRSVNMKEFVYIMFLLLYLIITIMITSGGFGSVITLITPLLMLMSFSNLRYTTKAKKYLLILGTVVITCLFLYSFPYGENYLQYFLTKINPNTLGMFMMFSFMIICVCSDFEGRKSRRGVFLLAAMSILGMYNYSSRGTTLALCCFILMLILPKRIYSRNRFFFIVVALIVIGTAVPFIYLNLYDNGYSMTIFGKSLYTGRERLWSNMFALMADDFGKIFFGTGSQTVLWESDLNVHNNFFNIIVNFGVFGFALYYILILTQVWKASRCIDNPVVRKSLIMFVCAVLILGFSETTSLWSVVFPFAYFGLIMANSECLRLQDEEPGNSILKREGTI